MATGLIGTVFVLPVLIAYWIGVVVLVSNGRHFGWWCLLIGTLLTTLGVVGNLVAVLMAVYGTFETSMGMGMLIGLGVSALGSVMFASGFAIHAFQVRSMRSRVEELEGILAAQDGQLAELNRGGLT